MLLPKRSQISYNPYFLFPFFTWVVAGGLLLVCCNKKELFDMANSHYNEVTDSFMYYITMMGQAEVIIPVLALVMLVPAYRNMWYFVTATVSNVIPLLLQQLLKSFFDFPRPLKYFHNPSWAHVMPDWPHLYSRSFPSGHSEGAFSFFCFLSLLLPRRYQPFGLLFFVLGLLVCYSRIYLAAHFFEDVYVGSIIGALITMFIFTVMNKYKGLFFKQEMA